MEKRRWYFTENKIEMLSISSLSGLSISRNRPNRAADACETAWVAIVRYGMGGHPSRAQMRYGSSIDRSRNGDGDGPRKTAGRRPARRRYVRLEVRLPPTPLMRKRTLWRRPSVRGHSSKSQMYLACGSMARPRNDSNKLLCIVSPSACNE
jgi:hypothetical protein